MKNSQKHPSVDRIFEDLFDEPYDKTLKALAELMLCNGLNVIAT